jgi:hypothetical protein
MILSVYVPPWYIRWPLTAIGYLADGVRRVFGRPPSW